MAIIKVRMEAFSHGEIREVEVPDNDAYMSAPFADVGVDEKLEIVFHWGQNNIQLKPLPSIAISDIILLGEDEYLVEAVGFKKLCDKCNLEDMCYPCYCDSYYKPGEERRHKHALMCERCE